MAFPQGGDNALKIFFVSRKCAVAACNSCTDVSHCAYLHAPQRPWVGTLGVSAMSVLLHRFGEISHHVLIASKIMSQLVQISCLFNYIFSCSCW